MRKLLVLAALAFVLASGTIITVQPMSAFACEGGGCN
jgi:hypothetical protein